MNRIIIAENYIANVTELFKMIKNTDKKEIKAITYLINRYARQRKTIQHMDNQFPNSREAK